MGLHRNVNDWERVASIALGTGLLVWAARQRSGRAVAVPLGTFLAARGGTGYCPVNHAIGRGRRRDDTRAALRGRRGVKVEESITIARPPSEVYAVWNDVSNLPRFMPNIERVDEIGGDRTHWVACAPGGIHLEWDAVVLQRIPGELISWKSLPGSDVATAGSVRFESANGHGTRVTVNLQYSGPGGKVSAALAKLIGRSPAGDTHEGLRRLKSLLEAGEVPTVIGQPHGKRGGLHLPTWVDG
ncbi:MAG TPA: SRPBCC family protein [Vicinamibacterales bacterium]|nr:SRPBCC family protein [Vicinamibacterales bacterium]